MTCTKTVRWNADSPYSYLGKDGEVQGIYADLMRETLRRMNCKAVFVEMPWARALFELEGGKLDVLPGAFKTEERERFALFSRPVNRSPNVLFVGVAAARSFRLKQLADILGTDFRLGVQIKVSYGEEYDRLIADPRFPKRTELGQRSLGWQMIDSNRIDGMIADESTALIEIASQGLENRIVKSAVVVSDKPSYIAFSKQSTNADFVARFDQAFGTMLKDGSYKSTVERYIPCTVSVEKMGCK
ncbi:transporter substrate-binding domain-containing protein [Rhodoferax sp. GW822-FHT02A01]|uniref:substrate-binding periplasmic protein n=1 Tax=Rhodoferax sp. GW822-FHT02A01 TaxID=3141537 RepID=UPI00315DA0D8